MRLLEFQGKRLFQRYGIPVPRGVLSVSARDAVEFSPPAVLKAQVLIGGRGKAGGIKVCEEPADMSELLSVLFARPINGQPVQAVLIEEHLEVLREYYLSVTYKGERAQPLIIASSEGGVDIEEAARQRPDKIVTLEFNALLGPTDYQVRYLARAVGCQEAQALGHIIKSLREIVLKCDAALVEINPLALTSRGLVALDAKVVLDDKAKFRQSELFQKTLTEQQGLFGTAKTDGVLGDTTITYVPLDGNVGLISDGAGTGMLTLDLISDAGGQAASFCEMGGITNSDVMYDAMRATLRNPSVKSLLIVLIGGFNRMDEMAQGVLRYCELHGLNVPMVIRMCGTMEEEGKKLLHDAGIPTFDDLQEAVSRAVALAAETYGGNFDGHSG